MRLVLVTVGISVRKDLPRGTHAWPLAASSSTHVKLDALLKLSRCICIGPGFLRRGTFAARHIISQAHGFDFAAAKCEPENWAATGSQKRLGQSQCAKLTWGIHPESQETPTYLQPGKKTKQEHSANFFLPISTISLHASQSWQSKPVPHLCSLHPRVDLVSQAVTSAMPQL